MDPTLSPSGRQGSTRAERGLLLLAVVALIRALLLGAAVPDPGVPGEAVDLSPESLQGAAFRLWPGVGPALAERLEAARIAAGGVLTEEDLMAVRGVGPGLMARWRPLWTLAAGSGVR